jgi:hypothetical protein
MPKPNQNHRQPTNSNSNKGKPAPAASPSKKATDSEEKVSAKAEELDPADLTMNPNDMDGDDDDDDDEEEDEEAEGTAAADSASTASTNEPKKEKRTRAKRQIIFVCAAFVKSLPEAIESRNLKVGDSALIQVREVVPTPPEGQEFNIAEGRKLAATNFATKYGTVPECIDGPLYVRKGQAAGSGKKRETISSTVRRRVQMIAKQGTAVHHFKNIDWIVQVLYTSDPTVVNIWYDKPVDEKAFKALEKKPTKPPQKYISPDHLTNIVITQDLTQPAAAAQA